jgi:hypothetical protein
VAASPDAVILAASAGEEESSDNGGQDYQRNESMAMIWRVSTCYVYTSDGLNARPLWGRRPAPCGCPAISRRDRHGRALWQSARLRSRRRLRFRRCKKRCRSDPETTRKIGNDPFEATQLDKFKQAVRELETDDDPKRFDERIAKLVKHKPVEKPD